MAINRSRLDRFMSNQCDLNKKEVRLIVAQRRILVDGVVASSVAQQVDSFSHIVFDGEVVQSNQAIYIMLNKPVGVVCATKDDKHKTVLELLDKQYQTVHIVGRLDLNTSGLVLLTNDSRWSERLTQPERKVAKNYHVTLQNPLSNDYVKAFLEGMYFGYEDITTLPAELKILTSNTARVSLIEGKYHQIKRMFGRFRNPVVGLHRESIGQLKLDRSLNPGESRLLTPVEVSTIA
mgnify:CR=1 FL=1